MNNKDEELELKRKISLGLYALVVVGAILTVFLMFAGKIKIPQMALVLLLLGALFAVASKLKLHVIPQIANNLIKKVKTNYSFLSYSQNDGIPENRFKEADFIKKYTGYQAFNFILGKTKDKDIILSDIVVNNKLRTSQKNETAILYKGVFGITDFVTENNIDMIIGPDIQNKFLNNVSEDMKKALGANRKIVRLENSEFERYFEVYCEDQVASRKIITLTFMEKMIEFRKKIKKNITLIYKNNKIYFFVENKCIVDSSKLFMKGMTPEAIEETNTFLNLIAEIVNRSNSKINSKSAIYVYIAFFSVI